MTSDTSYAVGLVPRCYALVPAAGVGARSGAAIPKQYVNLAGRPMLAHTLEALARVPGLAGTLVVISPEDDQFEAAVPGFDPAWLARSGGATRADSVAAGLRELQARGAQAHDWVLVHDAARCLLRPEWVSRPQRVLGAFARQPVRDGYQPIPRVWLPMLGNLGPSALAAPCIRQP